MLSFDGWIYLTNVSIFTFKLYIFFVPLLLNSLLNMKIFILSPVTRVLLYDMDTMSASFDIVTKENLWQYFEKWTHLKVKCKFCTPSVYDYLDIANFEMHIETVHKDIKKYELKYEKTSPNMYFKYINEKSVQCIICNLTIELMESLQEGSNNLLLKNHIQEHSQIQRIRSSYLMKSKYLWKYGTKSGDFEMKCLSCNCNVPLSLMIYDLNAHIEMQHLNILKNEQKSYWRKSQWSECVSSLESPATPKSFNIVTKENIWQYYKKNKKAICKICGFKTPYVQLRPTFTMHIKTVHDNTFKYEERLHEVDQWPWNYFKYFDEEILECIVCNLFIEPNSSFLTNHLYQHTEDELVAHSSYSCIWESKYCTTTGDFAVNCKICKQTVNLPVAPYVNQHLIYNYLTCSKLLPIVNIEKTSQSSECVLSPESDTVQETHKTFQSSTSVLSTFVSDIHEKTYDKIHSSESILSQTQQNQICQTLFDKVTEDNVWQYYERWTHFHVVCRFCTHFIHNFLNTANLELHFKIKHEDIVEYEDKVAKNEWPWQYFKYIDEEILQCIICNWTIYWSNCLTTDIDPLSLRLHLFEHTVEQRKDHTFYNWIWKYCIKNGDFEGKCCLCYSNITLHLTENLNTHIKVKHLDIFGTEKKTYKKSQSSECVSSLEMRAMAALFNITPENLWQYYKKLRNFKAFCRYCFCKFDYAVLAPNFTMHIKTIHNKIFQYEDGLYKWPWRFFKYFNERSLQCVICDLTIQPSPLLLTNHLYQHTETELEEYKFIWEYKYCTENYDYQMECSTCKENEVFSISPLLIQHLVENHSYILETNKQSTSKSSDCVLSLQSNIKEETYDICQSFELAVSLESDILPTSSNIANTKQLPFETNFVEYCTVFQNFNVKCNSCEYFSCIDFSSFEEHIDTRHFYVRNFEENFESSSDKQYLIINHIYAQCIICNCIIDYFVKHNKINSHISMHPIRHKLFWSAVPWQLKYFTKTDDLSAKCKICHTIVSFSISPAMKDHCITYEHLKLLKRFREINSTDEQSEDQPVKRRALLMNIHDSEDRDLE